MASDLSKSINVADGFTLSVLDGKIEISKDGKSLRCPIARGISVNTSGQDINVTLDPNTKAMSAKNFKMYCGTMAAFVRNAVADIANNYSKEITINGVGFRSLGVKNGVVTFSLGYSHQIVYNVPEGVTVEVDKSGLKLKIFGHDRCMVGMVVDDIANGLRSIDRYKKKGLFVKGQYYRFKEMNKK